ncbi:MAG: hypothetical protein ABH881_04005 [bacterium]
MPYCEKCRKTLEWEKSLEKEWRRCEICKKMRRCYNASSQSLEHTPFKDDLFSNLGGIPEDMKNKGATK